MKTLHNEGEDWASIKQFWEIFRNLKEQYIHNNINQNKCLESPFNKEVDTFYFTQINIRSLSFEEQMKNAIIKENKVHRLSRRKRKEILLAKLDMLIEDSLDKMSENNFRVYSSRRKRVLEMI